MRTLVVLLVPLTLLLSSTTGASALLPTIASGGDAEGGWVAFRVHSDGEPWEFMLGACGASQMSTGIRAYRDGEEVARVTTSGSVGSNGVQVKSALAEEYALGQLESARNDGCWGLGLKSLSVEPRTTTVVGWVAGDFEAWEWRLRGGPGVTLEALETGPQAWLLTGKDFAAFANAQAWTGAGLFTAWVAGGPYGAGAVVGGSATFDVHHHLYGSFSSLASHVLVAQTPEGPTLCPCLFDTPATSLADVNDHTFHRAWGPGTYSFHVTGASATPAWLTDVQLVVVDVRLPA